MSHLQNWTEAGSAPQSHNKSLLQGALTFQHEVSESVAEEGDENCPERFSLLHPGHDTVLSMHISLVKTSHSDAPNCKNS